MTREQQNALITKIRDRASFAESAIGQADMAPPTGALMPANENTQPYIDAYRADETADLQRVAAQAIQGIKECCEEWLTAASPPQ